MNYEMAYAAFNGRLPSSIREDIFYGSPDRAYKVVHDGAAMAHQKRCHEIIAALRVWRVAPYKQHIIYQMLHLLSHALKASRNQAIHIGSFI